MRCNPEANARVHGPHATPDEILTAGSTAARPPPEFNPLHQLLQVRGRCSAAGRLVPVVRQDCGRGDRTLSSMRLALWPSCPFASAP